MNSAIRSLQADPRLLPVKPLVRRGRQALRALGLPATVAWARLRLAVGVAPLSGLWAVDRGKPIHRHYLEQFLQEFAVDIRGRCLEFQEDSYATRFGGARVASLDILHKEPGNPNATLVADLATPHDIPGERFDCIICTHVLHVVFDLERVVGELHRLLTPGGALLVAVPCVSMCDAGWHELWRFTPEGLQRVLASHFGEENVTVRGYGNSLAAAGEIRGLAVHELTRGEIERHDPRFPVEVCARAVRS